jgi:hypothetical protein
MSTFNPPADIAQITLAKSSDVNAVKAATVIAFGLLPNENKLQRGTANFAVDTGTANTYVVALDSSITSYTDGLQVVFRPINSNTGSATINLNGLGAKSIRLTDSTPIEAGEISAGGIIEVRYSTSTGFFHLTPNSAIYAADAAQSAIDAAQSAVDATTNGAAQVALAADQVTLAANQANQATINGAAQVALAADQVTLAQAAYDSFDDRYLGAKTSNPTVDNDGNPLLTGALYWNSPNNEMRVYSGSAWLTAYLPPTGFLALSGGTMTGNIVFNTGQPLGTPASGILSNCSGAVGYGLKSATTTVSVNAAPAPTAGQVLMATSPTDATWQTLPSANGGANTQTLTSDLILSANSPKFQQLVATAPVNVIFPNATTVSTGINIARIYNNGTKSIGFSDYLGNIYGYFGANQKATINLADNTAASGIWDIDIGSNILDVAALGYTTPVTTGYAENSADYRKHQHCLLSLTLAVAAYVNSSGYVTCVSVDLTTGFLGTPSVVGTSLSSGTSYALFPLTSTTALLIFNNINMVVVSVSGSTISYGTPVTLSASYGLFTPAGAGGNKNIIKLSSTLFLTCGGWGAAPVITTITIVGTAITQTTTTITSVPEIWQAYYGWVALSPTSAILTLTRATGNGSPFINYVVGVTVSSGTATVGSASAGKTLLSQTQKSPLLPYNANKVVQIFNDSITLSARVLTISGTTVTASTELTIRSDASSSGIEQYPIITSLTHPQIYTHTSMSEDRMPAAYWMGGNKYLVIGKLNTADILTVDFTTNTIAATAVTFSNSASNSILTDDNYLLRYSNSTTLLSIGRSLLDSTGITILSDTTYPLTNISANTLQGIVGKYSCALLNAGSNFSWTILLTSLGVISGATYYGSTQIPTALRSDSQNYMTQWKIGSRTWCIAYSKDKSVIETYRLK